MGKVYNTVEDFLSVYFEVTTNQPLDTRESVKTFDDLLDKDSFGAVYETMKVLVQDEDCIYVLVSLPDAEEKNRWGNIGRQFVKKKDETTDLSPNKKLWKRLTIETINANNDDDEAGALIRAKNNLVNGALVYVANDITLGDGTTQKKGFYFCQNVDGEGRLTMAGGGVTTEEFNELNNKVDVDKVSTAIKAAIAALVDGAPEDLNTLKELSAALKDNPSVIEALNEAISNRYTKDETDDIIASYSTTEQMNEAIEASRTEITTAYIQAIEVAITKSITGILTAEY